MPAILGSASSTPLGHTNGIKRSGKKRIRSFTADERATHSVIEKQRREALNANFIELARLIPALAPVHRLSKSLIVSECINHLRTQREMCLSAAIEIQSILAENIDLVTEVNSWREQYAVGLGRRQAKPVGDAVQDLLKVDRQVFGSFPAGFGDNGPGEGHEEHVVGKGSVPQIDEHTEPIPLDITPLLVNNGDESHPGLMGEENILLQNIADPQSLLPDTNDITDMANMPNSFTDATEISTRTISLNGDTYGSLDNSDSHPVANVIITPSADLAEMNMHRTMPHDFPLEIDYFLPHEDELAHFGYIPEG